MGFMLALVTMAILLVMTDLILRGKKKLRIVAGIAAVVLAMTGAMIAPNPGRMEVFV